ncbi:MAG: signal peptidase II [Thermodesulfobacteriota bacterium]
MNKGFLIFLITTASVTLIDQLTKALITARMALGSVVEVIPGLLNIVYFRNTGSAFGLMRGAFPIKTILLALVTIGAVVVIAFMARRSRAPLHAFTLSLVSGGALGNLIDRLTMGSVVDFIDIYLGSYHWPAFNAADSAITTGVIASIILMYRKDYREENPPKKN